jgi:hypothetical protein
MRRRGGTRLVWRAVAMKATWFALAAVAAVAAPRAAQAQDFVEQIQAQPKHEWFGYTLVTDGTTLVAGDPQYTNTGNNCSSGYGAVNIYKKSGSTWPTTPSQTFTFTPDTTDLEENNYGHFLGLANNVLVVSSERDDDAALHISNAGSFFVYKRSSSTANFAQIGRVFSPNPQAGERFPFWAGLATNGTYIAAAESPGYPNANRVFVYQIQGNTVPTSPTVTITLPIPSGQPVDKVFITTNNTLVVLVSGMSVPFAYQLNGAATPASVDMSSSATGSGVVRPIMAGDGNTLLLMKEDTVIMDYYPQLLTFGTTGLTAVNTLQQPPLAYYTEQPGGVSPTSLTLKENQGFFITYAGFISGYKYLGGQYYPGGIVRSDLGYTFPQASFGTSVAFDGTDLFVGDRSLVITNGGSNMCTSPGAVGAIDVFHVVNTTGTGPHASVELEPWLNSTVFSMGFVTATNGTYVVAGSSSDPDATVSTGEVTLFENVSGVWHQVTKYPDAWDGVGGTVLSGTGFGTSVDIDTNFIAIGAPQAASASGVQTGVVYTSNGMFQAGPYLNEVDPPSTVPAGAFFGQSVALAGTTMLVGAPGSGGGTGISTRGTVYVYTYELETRSWVLTQTLHPTSASDNDYEEFGATVDIDPSATYIIVGIPDRAGTGAPVQGAVQIFSLVNGAYVSGGEFLAPSNFPPFANLATAVSIGANYAVASSKVAGAVMVFRRTGTTWVQDTLIQGAFNFGAGVALDGTRFAVGSPGEGKVYRYERINNVWQRTATLTSTSGTGTFGWSLDTKGGTLSIGEYGALTGTLSPTVSGAAYVIGLTGF